MARCLNPILYNLGCNHRPLAATMACSLQMHNALLAEAVRRRYLKEPQLVRSVHSYLSDYFGSLSVAGRVAGELWYPSYGIGYGNVGYGTPVAAAALA